MVTLTKIPNSPSAVFGSQASLAWEFVDNDVVLTQAVKATITITISGIVAGTLTINGVVFTVDNTEPYTATTFQSGTNQETVRNIANAVRANQKTANLFDISTSINLSGDSVLQLRAKDVGIPLKTTENGLTGDIAFNFLQGVAPDLKNRTFYLYQGFAVDYLGNEVALTPAKMLPPGYNYNTGQQQGIFLSLHEAMQSMVKLAFPSTFNASNVGIDFNPVRLAYIRYGTVTFDGCVITEQNLKVSPLVLCLAQNADYSVKNGISLFTPSGSGQADILPLSMGAEIGMPIHNTQYAWVSVFWNIGLYSPNAQPAYKYSFYNEAGQLFSNSPVFTATKPVLGAAIQAGVFTVPIGVANMPHTVPAGTAYIEVQVGSSISGSFVRHYKPYKYQILSNKCNTAEVYWKSPYGGWESLVFDELISSKVVRNSQSYFRDNTTRVFEGKANKDYKEWVKWLDDYGDFELTQSRKVVTYRTTLLDFSEQSQRYFQQFLSTPDKRLRIEAGKDGQTYWVAAARCLTKTNDFVLRKNAGMVSYEVELEIASNVDEI